MRVSCNREQLASAYLLAASVAPGRSPKPILQNVKLEANPDQAVFVATDLEIGVRVNIPGIEIEAPGSVVLPAKRFGDIVKESSDETLHIESDGTGITVWNASSRYKLPAENPDEFPAVSTFAEKRYHEVSAKLLREMIRRTVFATDAESTRYALGGVLLEMLPEKIIAVGTDGRRLAKMEGPAISVGDHETGEETVIVPSKAMQMIERALSDTDAEVNIAFRGNDVLIKSPRLTIYSALVAGRYPKWRDVFPKPTGGKQIDLTVGPFFAAVRQAAIVTSDESRGVDFTFEAGSLVLNARAADAGESRVEMPAPYDDEKLTITLDPSFLTAFLRVLNPEKTVSLHLTDAEAAAVLHTDDGYSYVIMPLAREK